MLFRHVAPFALAVLAAGSVFAQSDSLPDKAAAAKKIDEIAAKPGIYHQSCMRMERDASLAVIVTFAGSASHSQYQVTAKQFAELRTQRAAAIEALLEWLKASCEADAVAEEPYVNPTRTKLLMLTDLNAVAALPLLAKLAAKLQKAYDDASPETKVDWDKVRKMDEAAKKPIMSKVVALDRLGDVLSTILAILRQEKFEGLLKSDLEKDGEAKIAEKMKEAWFAELTARIEKNGGEVASEDRDMVVKDPVMGKAVSSWVYPKMTVTKDSIAQILWWVDAFGKLPKEKQMDAKGMSEWPINR